MNKKMTASDYIRLAEKETEQYSNWEADGQPVENFMYASATPASPVGACVQQIKQAVPYIFVISNSHTVVGTTQTAVLFGAYEFALASPLHGSDADITITMGNGKGTYAMALLQSMTNSFTTSKFRLSSDEPLQLQQTMTVTYSNMMDGRGAFEPVNISEESNLYANNPNIIEFYREINVDGNTKFEVEIMAATTLRLTIYPVGVIDPKQALGVGALKKTYAIKSLNAMVTSPQVVGSY